MESTPVTRVFISYCHDDVRSDRKRLTFFAEQLQDKKSSTHTVHFDLQDTRVGDDIDDYMQSVAQGCDIGIILLGPEYKQRILNKKGGVYKEFNILYQRHLDFIPGRTNGRQLHLVPVLFCGTSDTSVPEEIAGLLYKDLTRLYVAERNGRIQISRRLENTFSPIFSELLEKIRSVHLLNLRLFKRKREEYKNKLFFNTKSDWDLDKNHELIEKLFVKTKVYYWVSHGDVSFIIGRKGSGKSTITHVLPILEKDTFNLNIPIDINGFYLNTFYNILHMRGNVNSDLLSVFSRIDAFRFVWDCFFHIAYLYTVVTNEGDRWKNAEGDKLRAFLYDVLDWDTNKKPSKLRSSSDFNALFAFVFGKLPDFIDACVKDAKPEKFGAHLITAFHIDKFRILVFGSDVWSAIYSTTISRRRKITLTFDGFDTALELFRTESIKNRESDLDERVSFENIWLLSLILLVLDKGLKQSSGNRLYELLHCCIAIPYDRFLEMKSIDRDAYRHNNRFTSIRWTGIELSAMLRKRLVALQPTTEDKSLSLPERLSQVITRSYPSFPEAVNIEFNGRKYQMPLFLYVLRHTFWRPRDILTYYASLLSAADTLSLQKSTLNDRIIREVVADTTRTVVEAEFFNEFESVANVRQVVERFRHSQQMVDWKFISDTIGDLDFMLTASSTEELSIEEKIEFLYEVGFLGVSVPASYKNSHHKYAFIFNEDRFLQEKIGRTGYSKLTYVIHPIFCEFLQLETTANTELTLVFDWQYLNKNETMRHLRPLL